MIRHSSWDVTKYKISGSNGSCKQEPSNGRIQCSFNLHRCLYLSCSSVVVKLCGRYNCAKYVFIHILFVTRTHMLSYPPNTTLCSVQSFEDNSIHYGTGFHHSICGYSRIQHPTYHFQSSVIDLYVAEADLIVDTKSTKYPWKP